MSNQILEITDEDFPSLFRVADNVSIKAQNNYLFLYRLDLLLLILVSILSVFSVVNTIDPVAIPITLLLSLSFIVTMLIKITGKDKDWFKARIIAESVKTLSWRYMTGTEPFSNDKTDEEIDKQFTDELRRILKEGSQLASNFAGNQSTYSEITNTMRKLRNLPVRQRLQIYLHNRIKQQQNWYLLKAQLYKKAEQFWFYVILGAQALAVVFAIIHTVYPEKPINFTSFFVTLTSTGLAWLKIKQFQELSQTYGLTANELGLAEGIWIHVHNDQQLSDYVIESEKAISCEHFMWIARKGEIR